MNVRNLLAGIAVAMSLAACQTTPPQAPIQLTKDQLAAQKGRVAVGIRVAKPDLYLPGASCLLCIGVAVAANSSLNDYAKKLNTDELVQVRTEIVEMLRKKGVDAVAIEAPFDWGNLPDLKLGPNTSPKDFSGLAKGADHVVMINVPQIGFVRTYAAYVPTSDAKAQLGLTAYMVNTKTNALEWYDTAIFTRSADGKLSLIHI